jgi:hypothetical protein
MTRAKIKNKNTPSLTVTESPVKLLGEMLEFCRPAGSLAVQYFIDDFIVPLGAVIDPAGNAIVRVGDSSRVMWSSHTDTVHHAGGFQRVVIGGDRFKLASGLPSNCLGADCTTGVWLMSEMIRAGVAGLYVFHADEEVGGIGSGWLANNNAQLLQGIDFCIAFDRKGVDSVITHQFSGRTASDRFVQSIAPLLPFQKYKADSGGSFTDSASYTDLIGECTNLSVGYYDQHTAQETQSVSHALAMRDALLRFDESKLVASRVAGEVDIETLEYRFQWGAAGGSGKALASGRNDFDALRRYVESNPEGVASFLEDMGINVHDLYDFEDSYYRDSHYGRRL